MDEQRYKELTKILEEEISNVFKKGASGATPIEILDGLIKEHGEAGGMAIMSLTLNILQNVRTDEETNKSK